jgi:pimeloyl-ACP methyl ester carboxylesterase
MPYDIQLKGPGARRRDGGEADYDTRGHWDFVVDAYARPGAFTPSIRWYRARAARRNRPLASTPIEVPTIALWGDRDPLRPLDHREGFEQAFPRSESRVLSGVGHFVPAEAPDAGVFAIAELI